MNINEWDGSVDLNENIEKTLKEVYDELIETAVSRSPFQLARFVIQSHGTLEEGAGPIMRQQCLREIEICMEGIQQSRINVERLNRKEIRLKNKKEEDYDLDLAELTLAMRREILRLIKKLREYYVLKAILEELPKYSWKEFQKLEPERWTHRLLRQCDEHFGSLVHGLDRGDIQALKQGKSKDVLEEIGYITDDLIDKRLEWKNKKGITETNKNLLKELKLID